MCVQIWLYQFYYESQSEWRCGPKPFEQGTSRSATTPPAEKISASPSSVAVGETKHTHSPRVQNADQFNPPQILKTQNKMQIFLIFQKIALIF